MNPENANPNRQGINREQIKALALANGFQLKPQANGEPDLNAYVYEFAFALIENQITEIDRLTTSLQLAELQYRVRMSRFRKKAKQILNLDELQVPLREMEVYRLEDLDTYILERLRIPLKGDDWEDDELQAFLRQEIEQIKSKNREAA